ncbi:probable cyclin-dependent serine/threonine-protein kinase DDB_G0292550 [Rana temporaria]|uniref:probable cyclin-dependent serine/threonine-protein kinase DDB_G0292550 n=1 Tax=Rana temporaria TaxID=8407 RepID=UPI001AAD467D|nr:probable cyclin-dependent serine/threonine-protein kinase DDB_G0292550 [Rana temporaria]
MGTQKMAKYVAARGLLLLCLLVFIVPAKALKCHSCWGSLKECKLKEVTCPGSNDTCGSALMMVKSFPIKEDTVMKGCVSSKTPRRSISLSPSAIVKMSLEEKTCDTDLCNEETIQVSEAKENDLNCYSCISSGKDCNSDSMNNLKCRGKQDKCLDIWVLGNLSDITNANLKGCGEMNCSDSMMYTSRQSSVFVKCCNENFCNSELGFKQPDQTPNGLECISCNTIDGESCSPPNITTTKCYGSLTSCYELAGINMEGGKSKPVLLKGCATPSMCDSLLLPLLANLRGSRIRCCNGSSCNNNFTKDTLQASGYFPETGNQNDRKIQATYIGKDSGVKKPLKTGHAFNNHGSGGTYVSTPNYNNENNNYNMDDERLNTFSVVDVPPVSPKAPGGKQNVKGGSWNNDIKGSGANPTFSLYDALNGSNPGSVGNANPSTVKIPDSLYDNLDQEDQNVTDDNDLFSETTDGNDFVVVSETDIFSIIDIMPLDDDSNLTTTSQGSTKLLGSLYNNSYVSGTNASSPLSDGLNSAPSDYQNETDDNDLYSETTDGNDFVAVSETDIFSIIDIMTLDDDSNLTTTSQGPTKLLGSLDNNSYVSGTNASSPLSDGLNSAPSGSLSNQNLSNAKTPSTVNNSLSQQNENSADYNDLDSADQETTDGNVSVDAIESETFYNIEIFSLEDDDNVNTTSQEPTSLEGSWDSDYASESSYGLNSNSSNSNSATGQDYDYFSQQDQTSIYDSNLYSGGETFTNNSSTDNYTMHSAGNYPAGVNSNLSTTPQGQKPGGNTTLLSSNTTNSNISSVQHIPNFSSGEYGASGAHGNIPNKTTPSQYNCSSFTGGICPSVNKTQSQGHSNGSISAVTTNNFVSHGQGVSSHSGVGNNASNSNLASSVPRPGSGNITMTTSSAYVGNSNNVHKSPVTSQIQQNSHAVFQSSGYTTNVHNMSSALPGNVNGHGNSTSSTGDHAGENRANSSNVLVGSSPPGWHGNTNNSHSMPKDNGYGYGNGSGSGNSSMENGLYYGNGTNRSNSTTHSNGLISNSMPSAVHNNGSSNGTNSSSSNLSMTSAGGSYNGSSSSNHSTLGANQNGSFVGTSSGSKPVSTDNVHSYSNGSTWSNSSVHNPHMLSPGGYNGSYGNNSNFNNSGHSYVGSSNPNSTSGGGNFNHSNPKPNSENGLYLGNGTTRSNSSTHNGSDPTSTGNVHSNSSNSSSHNPHNMPPGGYYNNSTLNASNPNITTGGGYFHNSNMMPPEGNNFGIHGTDGNSSSYWNYDPNMLPPVMNGPPEGYFPGNSYDSNYSIYGAEGTSNGNIFMPPGGIGHGESNGNQNDKNSSYWNSYPNMPPPAIPGHYSNVGSNIPYHLLPGLNGSTTDNYNNLINMLSNATGLNSTVLSQRLKGVDLNKPGNLAAVLSSIPGFDPNRLSPALKTAIFSYNNNVSHTFYNTTGYNNNMHPSNWNISNLANNSYFLNVLSNMTNVSIAVLSQKLNEVNKGNQHNLTALLLSLPDFDRYRLPPEFRKEIFGMDTNLNNTNTDGFNHNMVPPGSGFGNNSNSGNFGNNGTSNVNTSLSGKDTDITYNGASSLRSKAGVLAIVFTITLLYVTELK